MAKLRPLAGERQKGESRKAVLACNDYLRMGTARSLLKLQRVYDEHAAESPTKNLYVLQRWSAKYGWVARAESYDAEVDRQKTEYRNRIMQEGLALDYERVNELTTVFNKLREEFEQSGLWAEDVKLSASGVSVPVEVFNKALIDSIRGVLDDIAKETGGRRQRTVSENIDYGKLTDEQLSRIAGGEDPLQVILSQ